MTLIRGQAKKQRKICRTTTTARHGGMKHRKETEVAMAQLSMLIPMKARVMLPRIQAK
jgi:hypothetical protein